LRDLRDMRGACAGTWRAGVIGRILPIVNREERA
jgi:hypothetical protein